MSLVPVEHWDYSAADMVRGIFTALSPRRRDTQRHIRIPGVGMCLPVRSGRLAIYLALKALALPPRARVGVPLYCCPVVLKAIAAAGFRARFIDIDPRNGCLSPTDLAAKSSEVDAVIAIHMFGNICEMPQLRSAAPGVPFIEDCAQALGSQLEGRFAGSFGEIATFSFRSGKYLSVGHGGAVYSGLNEFTARLSSEVNALAIPSRMEECVHVASTYVRSLLRRKPLWGFVGSRLWGVYTGKVGHMSQSSLLISGVYETDRKLATRRLADLPSYIEKQRLNASRFSRHLTLRADVLSPEPPGAFFNRLQYPLLLPSDSQCGQLAVLLGKDGISSSRPYKDIAAIARTHYGYAGDCPVAEDIARRVLVIPCNHALKGDDLERITKGVNRAWAEIDAGRAIEFSSNAGNSITGPSERVWPSQSS